MATNNNCSQTSNELLVYGYIREKSLFKVPIPVIKLFMAFCSSIWNIYPFIRLYQPDSKLNICIQKTQTKQLLDIISESFQDSQTLYKYLNGTIGLQSSDNHINIYENSQKHKIAIVNFDLHQKHNG
eukprot:491396_1